MAIFNSYVSLPEGIFEMPRGMTWYNAVTSRYTGLYLMLFTEKLYVTDQFIHL